jgi:WD40 repeat protein
MGIASIRGLAYLPDGSAVVAALAGGVAKLIAPSDGHEIRTFIGHAGGVNAVAVSADGQTLATASDDRTVRLWRISDGALLATLAAAGRELLSVALSPDGARVAAGAGDGGVFLWNRATGGQIAVAYDHVDQVRGMAFAASSARLYTASKDGSARAYAAADLAPLATPMQGGTWMNALAVSPDGAHVAIGDANGSLSIWRASDASLERRIQAQYAVTNLSYASDGTRIFASIGGTSVYVFPVNGSASTLLLSPIGDTSRVAASPAGGALFVATDWALILANETGQALRSDVQQGPLVRDVGFSPDGNRLAIGGDFGLVVRAVPAGTIVEAPDWSQFAQTYNGVAFSPDATRLATAEQSGVVHLWSTSAWQTTSVVATATNWAQRVAFSPDGTLLAAAGAQGLDEVYRVATGAEVRFLGYSDEMSSVAFSPDGTLIATGSDGTSKLGILKVSDWSDVRRIDGAHTTVADLAFSPDDQIVASTGDARITVWQVTGATARHDLYQGPSGFEGKTVAIPSDGALLLAGGTDGLLRQWSLPALAALPSLPAHGPGVVRARFSPDGRRLAAAYDDGTVWVWCRR